ncbi:MAG TPA: hypothetical protein VEP49_11070 [Acidimicrobiia bacterium]|nr:hypothetical protein [Acidimicrobiia bacterium]
MAEPSDAPDPGADAPAEGDAAPPADAATADAPTVDAPAGAGPAKLPRWRRILVGVLVVLVCILTPITIMGVWLRNTVLHTDQFVDTLSPLASDPAVQQAVANRLTNTLIDDTDLEARIKKALPTRAKAAAPFILGGAEQVVHDAALRVVQSDKFASLWEKMLRVTHTQVIGLLEGKGTDKVSTKNGKIVVKLGPVADKVLSTLKSKTSLLDNVDTSTLTKNNEVVLVDSKDLGKAQDLVDLLDKIAYILVIVDVVLLALAIWLSGNRRRTILRTALGIALAMALLLTVFNLGRSAYLDALPSSVNKDAATSVYDQVLSFLRTSVRTVFVLAIIVAIAAWLSGPGRAATKFREVFHREPTGDDVTVAGTFVGRYRNALRIAVVAIGLIILVALDHPKPVAVLVIAVLVLIGLLVIELLGRRAPAPTSSS